MDGIPPIVSSGNQIQEGYHKKVADMLSRPPISAFVVLQNASLSLEGCVEQYGNDNDFKEIYAKLNRGS